MPSFDGLSRALGILAAILGTYAAGVYWRAGLSLSHYDAKAHLVVARRIFDSLTPSWEQIGAVWLPLPHIINAIPVQIDWFYQTGAFAIALSIACFAIATACAAAIVRATTGSRAGAITAAMLFALNPNVLYLQSTPMTEPLLFALTSLVVLHLVQWARSEEPAARPAVGWTIVLACLTRYEAWPIVGAAIVAAAYAKWRNGLPAAAVVHEAARITAYAIVTVIAFMGLSFASTGQWLITGGFYVPDPKLQGQPYVVWQEIREGLQGLAGVWFVRALMLSVGLITVVSLVRRRSSGLLVTLALLAAIALPFYAFVSGHPFRIRYEVPLILGGAVAIGAGVAMFRWLAPLVAVPLLFLVLSQVTAFSENAPMLIEAQLDRNNSAGRRAVTECLRRSYDDTTIMASMGSLAHYMQELSLAGFDLADFIHEGSGPIWLRSYYFEPSLFAGWVLIEEAAEGGDMLFQRQKEWPQFLAAYDRVCEGGNVALYKRR
ncbi:MAG TPA: hypothetical protein VFZ31_05875 [Vicinamibacterales bacterium]